MKKHKQYWLGKFNDVIYIVKGKKVYCFTEFLPSTIWRESAFSLELFNKHPDMFIPLATSAKV